MVDFLLVSVGMCLLLTFTMHFEKILLFVMQMVCMTVWVSLEGCAAVGNRLMRGKQMIVNFYHRIGGKWLIKEVVPDATSVSWIEETDASGAIVGRLQYITNEDGVVNRNLSADEAVTMNGVTREENND